MGKFYNWHDTFSRQTGDIGEICWVLGAKDIGKTFGLRAQCINDFINKRQRFVEICRTKAEKQAIAPGYFDKLQTVLFKDWQFKTESGCGYIAKNDGNPKPEWELINYFVSLTSFQQEKKRTYVRPRRVIFDEAIIDKKDKYHRYLPDEWLILANLLDSISRQQPDEDYRYNVYLLGNACDLTCPLLRASGVTKIPEFGYSFYNDKHTLLHYVEPWDAQDRKAGTLVGRMLAGNSEAKMIFDNEFSSSSMGEVAQKSSAAKFAYGIKYGAMDYGIWIDYRKGIFYINEKIPRSASAVYALSKRDGSINYQVVKRSSPMLQSLLNVYYMGGLKYSSVAVRESFLEVLGFLGVK